MTQLQPGDTAPDFTLVDQNDDRVSLKDLRGHGVVLYFYPAAMTPGCTTEACDFEESIGTLANAGYTVLGVSRDEPEKLREFAARDHLTFTLLSDPDHAVHEAYGAWGEKTMYGKTSIGPLRSTFVIDPDGKVVQALYNVKATGHVARLKELVGA